SKELSGTYQSAVLNANKIDQEKIHIVDTLNTTFGLGLLLVIAADFRDKGFSAKMIKEKIEELVPRVSLFAVIDTLKYLKMGGRLSAGAALVAGILGIFPIISVQDGKVCAIGKARGNQACYKFIDNKIETIGISADYPISIGHSNSPDTLKSGEKHFSNVLAKKQIYKTSIGPVVGSHIGAGAFGIAFIKK
ncbi:MAG: DegV family protein, partial [Clostridia bacterium]